MINKNIQLPEVLINSESAPVTLVDDTIQYNAGSFKTIPNANVEDLLKRLPGMKIEKDGTVKAQGEKVQKVLVDGKEFFGNDPKIATKNLPADAIDKVQVYDKLSDQAQMTGFDDGNSEKTINLKLKKEKKKGGFGKTTAAAGSDGRYQGRFNINSFKGARQLSLIGMANNTNSEGFSFMDILNFTGALSQLKNGGGNINLSISKDDLFAGMGGSNNGINTTRGAGINFNNIIGSKTDFQGNYFYNRFNPTSQSTVQRQYFFPSNLYNQNSFSDNINNSHRLNSNADYQIDSFHSIKIASNLNYQQTRNITTSKYNTFSDSGEKINDGFSNNSDNSEGATVSTNILFRKKFHRKGRTLSLNILTNFNSSDGNGISASQTNFYNTPGNIASTDSINQKNMNSADLSGFNMRAVYTEPVFNKSLLEFNVGTSSSKNVTSKSTYDFNKINGKFDLVNDLLTSKYENSYRYTTAGFRIRRQSRQYNYAIGANWQRSGLSGKIKNGINAEVNKNFSNLLPNARIQYNFSRFKNIMLNYSTNTTQPSTIQLQPVADNTNPLYIKTGNPDLKSEYTHTVRLNGSFVDPFKNRNFFGFMTFSQTQNKIVNDDRINSLGVDSVKPINVKGVYSIDANFSYGFPVHILRGSFELSVHSSKYHGRQFINGLANTINTSTIGPGVRLNMSPTEKFDLTVGAEVSYSNTDYSIKSRNESKYLVQDYMAEASWQLPKGLFMSTDLNYRISDQYASGFYARVPIWNASISKQVLRFNRGELKIIANDILNRNTGISRSTNQNYIEDSRVNTLRRFFLVSFTYNLTKAGLNNSGHGGDMKIITR
jgi:hypothetical protein